VEPARPILYLIPSSLGNEDPEYFLPKETLNVIHRLSFFIVENEKTARAFLKSCKITIPQQELNIFELDKHNPNQDILEFLKPAKEGHSIGLLSEAGCPAVADPGALIVAAAHKLNITVKPLVGPSSLLLALMASGLDGQRFCFHGYLPIEKEARVKAIQKLEKEAQQKKETQLFIETPYRNNQMLNDLLASCNNETRVCLAVSLNTAEEWIKTLRIQDWKKQTPDINKKPCVFLLM
jgi:16S rRNA (cytidine1402-2'-O)-methyltransferase